MDKIQIMLVGEGTAQKVIVIGGTIVQEEPLEKEPKNHHHRNLLLVSHIHEDSLGPKIFN